MVNTQFLDLLPLWAVYLVTVLLALGAIELGFRLGRWRGVKEGEGGVGAMTGATLALLAFLLAIITGIAVDRFDTRRQLVVEEANAIGTAYLRAGYLAEPYRTESRKLYREYVDMRVAAIDPAQLAPAVARSEEIHTELWRGAETLAQADPSPVVALYIEALNDVIDLHTDRVIAAVTTRISSAIWLLLYGMAILTMLLVGVYNSMQGRRNLIAAVLLVLVFAAVMLLIVDLDRAQEGFIRVNQQALLDLQRQLNASGP